MTVFLLILSLLLNLVAFLGLLILYLRQNRFMQAERKQEKMIHEMEQVISAYIIEMKEENELFLNRLQEIGGKKDSNNHHSVKSSAAAGLPPEDTINSRQGFRIGKAAAVQAARAYRKHSSVPLNPTGYEEGIISLGNGESGQPPKQTDGSLREEDQHKDLYLKSLLNQIFSLQKQGLAVEEIAKKLNKGKTEIELLLKFNQKDSE